MALKGKDEDYVKLLKRQAADVDTMLAAMGHQLSQMTAAYREELENVERALLQVCMSNFWLHVQPECLGVCPRYMLYPKSTCMCCIGCQTSGSVYGRGTTVRQGRQ